MVNNLSFCLSVCMCACVCLHVCVCVYACNNTIKLFVNANKQVVEVVVLLQRAAEQQSIKKHEEATKLLQQRDSQITALSDNLVLVRTELDKSGRRNEELEDLAKSLNQQIEGEII